MKLNRVCLAVASMVITILVALMPIKVSAEVSHAVPEHSKCFVPVYLSDISSIPELNTDNWIDLAELPTSDLPDSAFQGFRLPRIDAIYTWRKSIIESLAAKCSVILIDYKEAKHTDLSALPIDSIIAIGICGSQARVVTTSALAPGCNPALVSANLMEFVALAKTDGLQ